MIYFLEGTLIKKARGMAVILCGGVGYKAFVSSRTLGALPKEGDPAKLFISTSVKEDAFDLFGFCDEPTLKLFEMFRSVSGVGPKTALALTDVDSVERLTAAILEKRADLILRTPGIGKKTAERVILELHSRLENPDASLIAGGMAAEAEVEEALVGLGYSRGEARRAAGDSAKEEGSFEIQLRRALKFLGSKQ
jgi:Holliday junction DNA helicase RuvA